MLTSLPVLITGLALLIWSADRFVEGSSSVARYFGMPPLLIGMVIVGFGTSAPEMVVSSLAAWEGSAGIALGNAYGSNITNIALILGITALIKPVNVASSVLRKELPLLAGVTLLTIFLLFDLRLTRWDSFILIMVFLVIMVWMVNLGLKKKSDPFAAEIEAAAPEKELSLRKAIFWLIAGLILLIVSSRMLVWAAVTIARIFKVSDMVIGLTIIAVGTSLPELASSAVAARRGEHDIALGNILGSNLFNTLAVAGIAGLIRPFKVGPETITRDMSVMGGLTLLLFLLGFGFKKRTGRINRLEGAFLLLIFSGYTVFLVISST